MKKLAKPQFGFKTLAEVKVPKYLSQPISTGNIELDKIISYAGGIIPSQVIFLTGVPGSGKTTVGCYAGAGMSTKGTRKPLLLSFEMPETQIKFQLGRLQGIDNFMILDRDGYPAGSKLTRAPERLEENMITFRNLLAQIKEMNPSCVVLDSIQVFASMMDGYNDFKSQKLIVTEFMHWAKATAIPVILVGHCNKDGKFEGPAILLRTVDTHIEVAYDKKEELRTISCPGKNRMGGNLDALIYEITPTGVSIGRMQGDKDDEDDDE